MKRILLWDPRFPDRAPLRLTLADAIASACVCAGIAAAADPADQGALQAGDALSPAAPVPVMLMHGVTGLALRATVLPLEVAQIAIAAGLAAPIGGTITVLNLPPDALLGAEGLPILTETDILRT